VAVLPGLDGRKMSKSYDNTIPLFEGGAKAMKEAVARIVTDSRLPGEPKDPEGAHLVTLYDAFATPEQAQAFRAALRDGLGWGDAKQQFLQLLEAEVAPMREKYESLLARPDDIEDALMTGAAKARALAGPLLERLRNAVGLRRGSAAVQGSERKAAAKAKAALPVFKQYRESDGKFYFKLTDADGRLLLQSAAFDQGREAGQLVARLKTEGAPALAGAPVSLAEGVSDADVDAALTAFREAD